MNLKKTLDQKKGSFIEKWFQTTIDSYPPQTAKVLGKASNRFDNPVGAMTQESLSDTFHLILEDFTSESLEKALDPIIRIRAVQVFSAAEAVAFVFALKEIGESLLNEDELKEFNKLVDKVALAAFNKYMKCREEIFLLKAVESKRRIHNAFERAGLVAELKEEDLI
jgi:hypothetical protein